MRWICAEIERPDFNVLHALQFEDLLLIEPQIVHDESLRGLPEVHAADEVEQALIVHLAGERDDLERVAEVVPVGVRARGQSLRRKHQALGVLGRADWRGRVEARGGRDHLLPVREQRRSEASRAVQGAMVRLASALRLEASPLLGVVGGQFWTAVGVAGVLALPPQRRVQQQKAQQERRHQHVNDEQRQGARDGMVEDVGDTRERRMLHTQTRHEARDRSREQGSAKERRVSAHARALCLFVWSYPFFCSLHLLLVAAFGLPRPRICW